MHHAVLLLLCDLRLQTYLGDVLQRLIVVQQDVKVRFSFCQQHVVCQRQIRNRDELLESSSVSAPPFTRLTEISHTDRTEYEYRL